MEIHNISEDIVLNSVQTIFESIKTQGNPEALCLCEQCKLDTICYVLNRVEPRYTISNRGITRIEQDWAGKQQIEADIATLVYKGIRLVNHNQRPTSLHKDSESADKEANSLSFELPTIIGRLFDGETFEPLTGAKVELYSNGELVKMRNQNWQNPYTLVEHTPGAYSFWPASIPAETTDINQTIEYSLKIDAPGYDPLIHFFSIPVISGKSKQYYVTIDKNVKLPDLFLFKPGDQEQDW